MLPGPTIELYNNWKDNPLFPQCISVRGAQWRGEANWAPPLDEKSVRNYNYSGHGSVFAYNSGHSDDTRWRNIKPSTSSMSETRSNYCDIHSITYPDWTEILYSLHSELAMWNQMFTSELSRYCRGGSALRECSRGGCAATRDGKSTQILYLSRSESPCVKNDLSQSGKYLSK